jgi:hypothetical protein
MEAERYRRMCRLVDQVSPHGRRQRQQFADRVIVKVYVYATLCDRPVSFACDAAHWDAALLDEVVGDALPSQPTMSRRLRTVGVLQTVERAMQLLADDCDCGVGVGVGLVKAIDSKPLRVGAYSKDTDALRGRAAGEMGRGYKLHACRRGGRFVGRMLITPMNTSDQVAAAALIPHLSGAGYLAGDNGYDANAVHELAAAHGHQLVAPPRASNVGVYDARRNAPQRLRSLEMLDPALHPGDRGGGRESFGQSLMRYRKSIERGFGHAAMHGLFAPPPWVRRPHRVALWAATKLIQTMVRQREIEGLMT